MNATSSDFSDIAGAVMTEMDRNGLACEPALLVVSSRFPDIPWDIFWKKIRPIVNSLTRAKIGKHTIKKTFVSASHDAREKLEDNAPVIE